MLAENLPSPSLSKFVCLAVLTSLFAFCPAAYSQTAPVHGKWQRQIWNGIGGTNVSDLTSSPRFYQTPNSQTLTDSSYTQLGKNYYGARSRGYITPTATGLYTFWVAGDDEAQWFVSSTTSKSDARMISSTSAATPVDGWDQSDSQRSKSQFMEAGKSYYVELLHKQATGNDSASVAWAMQGVDASAVQNWATTANGATASQSSNFDRVNSHPASNVIDGNESTYNYTSSAPGTWLQVDLGQDRPISSVELYNRQDNQSRLSDFRLSVINAQNHVVASKDFHVSSGSVGVSESWNLPEIVTGNRVKIEFLGPSRQGNYYLNLGEMRVFGYNLTLKNWSHMPVAVATQSTSYSAYYPAANLMDGNVDTFQHTANVAGSWVQVDLGADRMVDTVELINRLSICQNRLSNFRVSVLNAADAVVTSHDYYLTSGSVQGALRWELPQAVTGRKVRITLLGLNRDNNYYLHLAELNVWGRSSALVSTRGLRSLIPSTVMSSFVPSLSDDHDDDGIPDTIELANGLNPDDPTDATQDFDHDGIKNLVEIRAGSNPLIWDSVPGVLVDEIWLNVPGESLDASTYKTAFTRDPDIIANVTTTRALNEGDNSIRRIRGLITAPVTGAYQFWGAADDDFSFYLSNTVSKFNRTLVIDNNILSGRENYDIDISQKSRLINLVAGQKYYFELWHKQGVGRSVVSLSFASG